MAIFVIISVNVNIMCVFMVINLTVKVNAEQ